MAGGDTGLLSLVIKLTEDFPTYGISSFHASCNYTKCAFYIHRPVELT